MLKYILTDIIHFESRVIYYGRGTRNEYRITRFWAYSPYDKTQQVGNLIVFLPLSNEDFRVYILDKEKEIEKFIDAYSLSLMNNNAVYENGRVSDVDLSKKLEKEIEKEVTNFGDFPATIEMAEISRRIYREVYKKKKFTPDNIIIEWVKTEYSVFKAFERNLYKDYITKPFREVELLVEVANTILNRRKSRAGKSLEHHIDFLFSSFNLPFSHPGNLKEKKTQTSFIPSNSAYADMSFLQLI